MNILITGGTGFAGSHLIEELLKQGYTDIYSTVFSAPTGKLLPLPLNHYIQVDLSDKEATVGLVKKVKPDWVFHLASFAYVGKSFEKAEELFSNNIRLQLSLLEAMRVHAANARILTIGSAEEYGVVPEGTKKIDESFPLNPVNPYAVSKVTQDLLANSYFLSYKLQIVRARPFNHIGTRQTGDFAIPSFARQIVAIERGEQEVLYVGNLTAVRDFTCVEDMVKAYILLMEKGKVGDVYNIGTGVGLTMKEIVDMLCSLAKKKIVIQEDASRIRPLDVPILIADNEKVRSLGWKPQGRIIDSLQAVLEEFRATQ